MAESRDNQDRFRQLLDAAASGKLPWLAKLLGAVGYVAEADRWRASAAELSALFAVTPRTLTRWRADKNLPAPTGHPLRWDVGAVLRWALEQGRAAAAAETDEKRAAEIARLREQTGKLRMEREILEQSHVALADVEATTTAAVHQLRASLLAIPAQVSDDPDDQERIADAIRSALETLAAQWEASRET